MLRWTVGIALAVAIVLIGAWQFRLVGDFRVDDAYITFSFSKNLGHRHGPVFSTGERVEGYSNFLWMVVLALPYALGAEDATWFARVLGALSALSLVFVTYRLARRRARPLIAASAPLLLLMTTDVFRAVQSSLETVPYALALAAATWGYLAEDPRRRRWSLFGFVVVALVRIDGMAPLAFVLAFELASALLERRFSAKAFLRWAGPPLLAYAIFFAWRFAYYGMPLPSTYYAKELANSDPQHGPAYATAVWHDWGVYVLAPFAALALLRWRGRDALFVAAFIACEIAYVIRVGGDWMPFQRFWLPVLPFAVVLAAWGADLAWAWARRFPWFIFVPIGAAFAVAVAFVGVHVNAARVDTPYEGGKIGYAEQVIRHTNVELMGDVRFLRPMIRRPRAMLVTDYAGVFAVFTNAQILDMWGLCNAKIARKGNAAGINPIYGKTCIACYPDFDPDYFHTETPLVRDRGSFGSHADVINAVFQGSALDPVINLRSNYVTGRVTEVASGRSLWFLERRRDGNSFAPREGGPGLLVEYPFGG